jgi:hypothetical protein
MAIPGCCTGDDHTEVEPSNNAALGGGDVREAMAGPPPPQRIDAGPPPPPSAEDALKAALLGVGVDANVVRRYAGAFPKEELADRLETAMKGWIAWAEGEIDDETGQPLIAAE